MKTPRRGVGFGIGIGGRYACFTELDNRRQRRPEIEQLALLAGRKPRP